MRKLLFLFFLGAVIIANAQTIALYKNGSIINTYSLQEIDSIVFNKQAPEEQKYVDLGLPSGTLWATCNIGADSPEDYGDYFAWGETIGYTSETSDGRIFNWNNYKWCDGSYDTMTKYCTKSSYGTVDNKTELEDADDAATANWGSNWCMPTYEQQQELLNSSYTTTSWVTKNGIKGRLITSISNGNSIFLPAAGVRLNSGFYDVDLYGHYWSKELYTNDSKEAWIIDFGTDYMYSGGGIDRYLGLSIRAVRAQSSSSINLLAGKFTVNSDGKQVQFTKGNLYWNGSDFELEENQTDYPTSWNSKHVGHFSWTNIRDYQSEDNSYKPYVVSYIYTVRFTSDEFFCGNNNPISISGTEDLYCMTQDEFKYILNSRTNYAQLYLCGVTVGSTENCLILAPDDYDYVTNPLKSSYTLEELKSNGLICLPAAGHRYANNFYSKGSSGDYWSASPDKTSTSYASGIMFNNEAVSFTSSDCTRNTGKAIRLVKTVTK